MRALLAVLALPVVLLAPPRPVHYDLSAAYVAPARTGAPGYIAVYFTPKSSDLAVDKDPPPRLALDPLQTILVDKQPPAPQRAAPVDPATAQYLDTKDPVSFAVALSPEAPKGVHDVKATVTYFYCSKEQGWCRRGSAEVQVRVVAP